MKLASIIEFKQDWNKIFSYTLFNHNFVGKIMGVLVLLILGSIVFNSINNTVGFSNRIIQTKIFKSKNMFH